eukprot:CAMPEP_0202369302 /NCGR_PEP_ID=MMETSP1127-20130417/1169_1 /ASSEMBLY_ACC=CAM_ASM_000462 /TAXON_ID=3047 /ORGANISM="Dunaliella tertiolecta, Strain CCMP1320" /LENGTH=49 /DNA_ID=CAMNT_0048964923 /DNA_START=186 /DNA_END=335 /DNA_ORIENTATION=+
MAPVIAIHRHNFTQVCVLKGGAQEEGGGATVRVELDPAHIALLRIHTKD